MNGACKANGANGKRYSIAALSTIGRQSKTVLDTRARSPGGLQLTFSNHRVAVALRLRRSAAVTEEAQGQAEFAAAVAPVLGLSSLCSSTNSTSNSGFPSCSASVSSLCDWHGRRSDSPSLLSVLLAPVHSTLTPFRNIFSPSSYLSSQLRTVAAIQTPAPAAARKEPTSLPSSCSSSSSSSSSSLQSLSSSSSASSSVPLHGHSNDPRLPKEYPDPPDYKYLDVPLVQLSKGACGDPARLMSNPAIIDAMMNGTNSGVV